MIQNKQLKLKKYYYRRTNKMSKISNDGAEQLQTARNALNSIYNKLDSKTFEKVKEEFSSMGKILADVQDWERV